MSRLLRPVAPHRVFDDFKAVHNAFTHHALDEPSWSYTRCAFVPAAVWPILFELPGSERIGMLEMVMSWIQTPAIS